MATVTRTELCPNSSTPWKHQECQRQIGNSSSSVAFAPVSFQFAKPNCRIQFHNEPPDPVYKIKSKTIVLKLRTLCS